jgi:hypothetical protein
MFLSWHKKPADLKTKFPTYNFRSADLTEKQVLRCITSHCWSPVVYREGHRQETNFIKSKLIGLDFDGDYRDLTIEQAIENVFCDLKCFIGPTKSHRKNKNGIIADRFRVIIELEDYITEKRQYRYMSKQLATFYGSDPKAVDAARFFYPCSEIVAVIDGEPHELIKPPNDFEKPLPESYYKKYSSIGSVPPRITNLLNYEAVPSGKRNSTFYGVAKDLKKLGYDQERVAMFILSSPTYMNDSKYEKEIKATVASAYRSL